MGATEQHGTNDSSITPSETVKGHVLLLLSWHNFRAKISHRGFASTMCSIRCYDEKFILQRKVHTSPSEASLRTIQQSQFTISICLSLERKTHQLDDESGEAHKVQRPQVSWTTCDLFSFPQKLEFPASLMVLSYQTVISLFTDFGFQALGEVGG